MKEIGKRLISLFPNERQYTVLSYSWLYLTLKIECLCFLRNCFFPHTHIPGSTQTSLTSCPRRVGSFPASSTSTACKTQLTPTNWKCGGYGYTITWFSVPKHITLNLPTSQPSGPYAVLLSLLYPFYIYAFILFIQLYHYVEATLG